MNMKPDARPQDETLDADQQGEEWGSGPDGDSEDVPEDADEKGTDGIEEDAEGDEEEESTPEPLGPYVPLIFEIRHKYSGQARRADTGSPRAAIRLGCLECMGGSRAKVTNCKSFKCTYWELRHGRGREKRPEGTYPDLPAPRKGPAGGAEALAAWRTDRKGIGQ